jgi:hypothetical protein
MTRRSANARGARHEPAADGRRPVGHRRCSRRGSTRSTRIRPSLANCAGLSATSDGKDRWVDGPGEYEVMVAGKKMVKAMSRTYIPASVKDNPYYVASGYEAQLTPCPSRTARCSWAGSAPHSRTAEPDHPDQVGDSSRRSAGRRSCLRVACRCARSAWMLGRWQRPDDCCALATMAGSRRLSRFPARTSRLSGLVHSAPAGDQPSEGQGARWLSTWAAATAARPTST